MCLVFVALQQHPDYPVIIAANRDEFYRRPTQAMHWWSQPAVLAGKDCEAGGTWLALDRNGRFAVVTNYREVPTVVAPNSRGYLPLAWLQDDQSANHFAQSVQSQTYAGFNVLFGNLFDAQLFHISNRTTQLTELNGGIHGLSNALLNTPWPKVSHAKPLIAALCQQAFDIEAWFALLVDKQPALDTDLPRTGVPIESERLLSSRFIRSDDYGTRCSTVIAADTQRNIDVWERSFDSQTLDFTTQHFAITHNHLNGIRK